MSFDYLTIGVLRPRTKEERTMNRKTTLVPIGAAIAISLALGGCATSSKDIAGAYISPMQYQNFDCDQLGAESTRLATRLQQLGGRLDEAASNDKGLTAVSVILFWPAAFALGGTKNQEAEFARLKGEFDAIQQAAVGKRCPGIMPVAAPAASPAASAASTPKAP